MQFPTSMWLEAPGPGEVVWEFVRRLDGKRLRRELRDAAPDVWQVLVYQDDALNFEYRAQTGKLVHARG